MTRDELMALLVEPARFDKAPNSEKREIVHRELQTILLWMLERPRPQPDAWESFYLAAAIGQIAARNDRAAFSCIRKVFEIGAGRHTLLGMPPTSVEHLERALAMAMRESSAVREPAESAVFRSNRFPVAA